MGRFMAVYAFCYLAAYFLARWEHYYLSGTALLAAAVWLYYSDYRKTKNIIHLRALFSLFWVGGQGLSCLKLSHLQTDWSLMTWVCLALAYAASGQCMKFSPLCLERLVKATGGGEVFPAIPYLCFI